MKRKTNLARYVVLSIFVHVGVLLGVNAFLRSPPALVPVELIPVETIVLEEEPISPPPQPRLTRAVPGEKAFETKSEAPTRLRVHSKGDEMVAPMPTEASLEPLLNVAQTPVVDPSLGGRRKPRRVPETKSRRSVGTETTQRLQDLGGPIPKEGTFEPSLDVRSLPTLGVLPSGREGKAVVSDRVISTPKTPPLRLSPVQPSPLSRERPQAEVEVPRILIEVQTGGTGPYSQTQKKVVAPIGRNRTRADIVPELPPIPTVESPSLPEEREMIVPASGDLPQEPPKTGKSTARLEPIGTKGLGPSPEEELTGPPEFRMPEEETVILERTGGLALPIPGSARGAAFLFVLDTSGSVKGSPLEGIKRSAAEFVGLMGPNDLAGIMTFNDTIEMVQPFTSEKGRLRQEIAKIRTHGRWTLLFDALIKAVEVIREKDREGKFLILFSDGKDEGSRASLQDVIRMIRRSGVSIVCVGYSKVEKKYLETLRTIASQTGGIAADAPEFHDVVMLYKAARTTEPNAPRTPSPSVPQRR